MGHFSKTSNLAHDTAINAAEAVRQVAVAAATKDPAGQVAVISAEITFHRAVLASCKANNSNAGLAESLMALKALGTGGN